MLYTDLMIDIETMGVNILAPVVSIGAVWFNPATGAIAEDNNFYQRIALGPALEGRNLDGPTLAWWLRQDDEARLELTKPGKRVEKVLAALQDYVGSGNATGTVREDFGVWGSGACFDITLIETLFQQKNMNVPWKFWQVRDVRTVVAMAGAIGLDKPELKDGTAHNALDDAIHQAKYVSEMWQTLTGGFE